MLILLLRPFINTKEEIDKDIGIVLVNSHTYLRRTISTIGPAMLLLLISISLASIYSYDYENRSPGTYAQNGNNNDTVQLNCLDIALVLAVLDFSIELGDKESVDETLKESEIAPDLESVYGNLDSVLDTVQAKCPNEQDILQYSNFSK
jgi:hypothetical protein